MAIYNPTTRKYVSKREFNAYMSSEFDFLDKLSRFGTACPRRIKELEELEDCLG